MEEYIPGVNAPTFRELVKQNQNKRNVRLENKFIEKMEESLIKWNPAASSHKGTLMAVNGIHPFQLDTTPIRVSSEHFNTVSRSTHDQNHISTRSTKYADTNNSMIHSFVSWLYNSSLINEGTQDSPERRSDSNSTEAFEPDGLSFMPSTRDVPYTPVTPVILPLSENEGSQQINGRSNRAELNTRTNRTQQVIYESFYDVPIPVTYLDAPVLASDNAAPPGNDANQTENKGWASNLTWLCSANNIADGDVQTNSFFPCFQ